MEKVTTYKLSNGKEIASESMAELGQKIIDATKEIHKLAKHLASLKKECTCEEKVKIGTPTQRIRTVQNSWGEDCGEVYTVQSYSCNVCGSDSYHHIEDNEWFKW